MGKTYAMRYFAKSLPKSLYKVIYIPLATVTVAEFYRALSYELGLEPCNKKVHEALKQRIVINYTFEGIQKSEVEEYILSRLKLCGVERNIFNSNSYEALASCCSGSIRKLNSLIEKCLILGCQKGIELIDTEIVMSAQNDIELV